MPGERSISSTSFTAGQNCIALRNAIGSRRLRLPGPCRRGRAPRHRIPTPSHPTFFLSFSSANLPQLSFQPNPAPRSFRDCVLLFQPSPPPSFPTTAFLQGTLCSPSLLCDVERPILVLDKPHVQVRKSLFQRSAFLAHVVCFVSVPPRPSFQRVKFLWRLLRTHPSP